LKKKKPNRPRDQLARIFTVPFFMAVNPFVGAFRTTVNPPHIPPEVADFGFSGCIGTCPRRDSADDKREESEKRIGVNSFHYSRGSSFAAQRETRAETKPKTGATTTPTASIGIDHLPDRYDESHTRNALAPVPAVAPAAVALRTFLLAFGI
jgi:hypothetical protein